MAIHIIEQKSIQLDIGREKGRVVDRKKSWVN